MQAHLRSACSFVNGLETVATMGVLSQPGPLRTACPTRCQPPIEVRRLVWSGAADPSLLTHNFVPLRFESRLGHGKFVGLGQGC